MQSIPTLRQEINNILKDTGMTHHNFEVILHDNCKIESKVIDDNNRKFISLTVDGLPMKQLISIIRESHTCSICNEKFLYLTDLTSHMHETHNRFFATFYQILVESTGCPKKNMV